MTPQPDHSGSICEVCEKPTVEPITHPEEGIDFCGRCAVELIGAERDQYRKVLERIGRVHGPWRPVVADALGCSVDDLDPRRAAHDERQQS